MLDTAQAGDAVLDLARHLGFQLLRRRSFQLGVDDDGGQFNVREVLNPHAPESGNAEQGQQREQQDAGHRVANGPGGNIHRDPPNRIEGQGLRAWYRVWNRGRSAGGGL